MLQVKPTILPHAVLDNIIFHHSDLPELALYARVCKAWNEMVQKHLSAYNPTGSFGPKDWYTYFGCRLKNVQRLPSNIEQILSADCPFWASKKVRETHLLVLIPQIVHGKALNLKLLGELVEKPLQGHATKYDYFDLGEYTDPSAPKSHWALLTRDIIEGSRNKPYSEQEALIKAKAPYEVPTLLDATVCIFMEYIRSGVRLYSNNPYTVTGCQEKYNASYQLVVGGFSAAGLHVRNVHYDREYCGVGGLRKF
jgi:hypothetical protein